MSPPLTADDALNLVHNGPDEADVRDRVDRVLAAVRHAAVWKETTALVPTLDPNCPAAIDLWDAVMAALRGLGYRVSYHYGLMADRGPYVMVNWKPRDLRPEE